MSGHSRHTSGRSNPFMVALQAPSVARCDPSQGFHPVIRKSKKAVKSKNIIPENHVKVNGNNLDVKNVIRKGHQYTRRVAPLSASSAKRNARGYGFKKSRKFQNAKRSPNHPLKSDLRTIDINSAVKNEENKSGFGLDQLFQEQTHLREKLNPNKEIIFLITIYQICNFISLQ